MLKKFLPFGLAAIVLLAVPVFLNLYTPRYETRRQRYNRGYEYYHKEKYKKAANALAQAVELDSSHPESRALLRAVYRATDDMENYKAVLAQAVTDGFDENEIKLLDWLLSEGVVTPSTAYEISGDIITYYDEYGNKARVENYGNLDRVPVHVSKYYPEDDSNLYTHLNLPYVESYERWEYNAEGKLLKNSSYDIERGLTTDNSFVYNEYGKLVESNINYPNLKRSYKRIYTYHHNNRHTLDKVTVHFNGNLQEIYYFNEGTVYDPAGNSVSTSVLPASLPFNYHTKEEYVTTSATKQTFLYAVHHYGNNDGWTTDTENYKAQTKTEYFNPEGSLKEYVIYEYYTTDNVPPGKEHRISHYAAPGEKVVEENRYSADGSLISYCLTYYDEEVVNRLRIERCDAQGELIYGWVN